MGNNDWSDLDADEILALLLGERPQRPKERQPFASGEFIQDPWVSDLDYSRMGVAAAIVGPDLPRVDPCAIVGVGTCGQGWQPSDWAEDGEEDARGLGCRPFQSIDSGVLRQLTSLTIADIEIVQVSVSETEQDSREP